MVIQAMVYIPKEPHLIFRREHRHAECMNRRIPKSLIVEPSCFIQVVEVLFISLGAEEIEIADFEVTEELTVVVFPGGGVEQPGHVGLGMD